MLKEAVSRVWLYIEVGHVCILKALDKLQCQNNSLYSNVR